MSSPRILSAIKKNNIVFIELNFKQAYRMLQVAPPHKTWLLRQSETYPGTLGFDYRITENVFGSKRFAMVENNWVDVSLEADWEKVKKNYTPITNENLNDVITILSDFLEETVLPPLKYKLKNGFSPMEAASEHLNYAKAYVQESPLAPTPSNSTNVTPKVSKRSFFEISPAKVKQDGEENELTPNAKDSSESIESTRKFKKPRFFTFNHQPSVAKATTTKSERKSPRLD